MKQIYEPSDDSFLLEKYVKKLASGRVLDMGTGSGIQTKAAEKNSDSVLGVDIDKQSIDFCNKTIKSEKISFKVSDLFSDVEGKFDTIIFNAPYLPSDERIDDPALYGGKKGYEIIGRFLSDSKKFLASRGIILLLFSSFTDKNKVDSLIMENGFGFEELERIHISFEDMYCYMISKGNAR